MAVSIDEIILKYSNSGRGDLLELLQEIQENSAYLSEEAITKVADLYNLPTAKIYGIATFYDQFRFHSKGKFHIKVCNGTACHLSASKSILKEIEKLLKITNGQTSRDGLFSLEEVACMGSCGLSPVILINEDYYTSLKVSEIKDILENLKKSDD